MRFTQLDQHADFPPPPEEAYGIGHNSHYEPLTPEQVTASVADSHGTLSARRDQLVQAIADFAAKHPVITAEDVAAAATENLDMIKKAIRMGEDQRTIAKEPYLLGGRAVDAWFKAVEDSLKAAKAKLDGPGAPLDAYAKRIKAERLARAQEAARVLAREAERTAQAARDAAEAQRAEADHLFTAAIAAATASEKADAHAAAKPSVHSRMTGTYGATSSLKETWKAVVTDAELLPDKYWTYDDAAIQRDVRAGMRDIPGCTITCVESLR